MACLDKCLRCLFFLPGDVDLGIANQLWHSIGYILCAAERFVDSPTILVGKALICYSVNDSGFELYMGSYFQRGKQLSLRFCRNRDDNTVTRNFSTAAFHDGSCSALSHNDFN